MQQTRFFNDIFWLTAQNAMIIYSNLMKQIYLNNKFIEVGYREINMSKQMLVLNNLNS
jgi:hypothetical protein